MAEALICTEHSAFYYTIFILLFQIIPTKVSFFHSYSSSFSETQKREVCKAMHGGIYSFIRTHVCMTSTELWPTRSWDARDLWENSLKVHTICETMAMIIVYSSHTHIAKLSTVDYLLHWRHCYHVGSVLLKSISIMSGSWQKLLSILTKTIVIVIIMNSQIYTVHMAWINFGTHIRIVREVRDIMIIEKWVVGRLSKVFIVFIQLSVYPVCIKLDYSYIIKY